MYFHKTVIAAEAMIRSFLYRAIVLLREEKQLPFQSIALATIAKQEPLSVDAYISLDDTVLLTWLTIAARADCDSILKSIATDYLERRLFKPILITKIRRNTLKFDALREQLESAFPNEYKYFCVFEDTQRRAYKPKDVNQILIIDGNRGSLPIAYRDIVNFEANSTVSNSLINVEFEEYWLLVSPSIADRASNIVQEIKKG